MNRIFLSWNKPACCSVADFLLSLGADCSKHLVLVPTRESGRQLREWLAAESPRQAMFSPRVLPAEQLIELSQGDHDASRLEELAGWIQALGASPRQQYPLLFPKEMPEDFASLLDMASSLQSLRHAMTGQGVSCKMAAASSEGRDERWEDMERLTDQCTEHLNKWRLADTAGAMNAEASPSLLQSLRETGGHIIVACVPDLPLPLRLALKGAEEKGIPVDLCIHAPEQERDSFDEWGRPRPDVWSVRNIPVRDDQIHMTPTPGRLADETCRIIAETNSPMIALGVCDQDMNVALDARLRHYGWGLHNPEGKPFAGTGIMDLLRHLQQALEEQGKARPLFNLMRSSLLCASLDINKQKDCCTALDKIRQIFLPETEEYLLKKLREEYPETLDSLNALLAWRDRMTVPGKLGEQLQEWIPSLAAAYGKDSEAVEQLRSCTANLVRLQTNSVNFSDPLQALPLLIKCLQTSRVKSKRADHAVLDALGWMEIHFRPEPHLVITGLNDGMVPEGSVADQFIPEELREALGINSFSRKKARDSFLLTALLHSREKEGSLSIVLSRTSSKNDPLTPSSLLMRCPDEQLPRRVEQLFRKIAEPPPPLPYRRGSWNLQPDEGWKSASSISAMMPGYHNPWKEGKRHFSPSVLKKFLSCPMRFWIREALHMSEDQFLPDKEDMAANEIGNMLHAVLERFGRTYPSLNAGMTATALQADVTSMLEDAFLRQYGPRPLMPLILQKRDMEQRLSTYAEQHLQDLEEGWSCIAFERQVEDWKLGGFPMKFRIDRIDRHQDGRIRVIDYKTGTASSCEQKHLEKLSRPDALSLLSPRLEPYTKQQKNGNAAHSRWKDLQLPIYVLWAMDTYGGLPEAAYYTLPANPLNIGLARWDTLHEPAEGYDISALDSARSWAVELMTLIHQGRGLITAEELGWKTPAFDVFHDLLSGRRETLHDLLGLPITPHLPF